MRQPSWRGPTAPGRLPAPAGKWKPRGEVEALQVLYDLSIGIAGGLIAGLVVWAGGYRFQQRKARENDMKERVFTRAADLSFKGKEAYFSQNWAFHWGPEVFHKVVAEMSSLCLRDPHYEPSSYGNVFDLEFKKRLEQALHEDYRQRYPDKRPPGWTDEAIYIGTWRLQMPDASVKVFRHSHEYRNVMGRKIRAETNLDARIKQLRAMLNE